MQEGSIWGAGVGMSFDGENVFAITANNDASGANRAGAQLPALARSTQTGAHGHLNTKSSPDRDVQFDTVQAGWPLCMDVPGGTEMSLLHTDGIHRRFMATLFVAGVVSSGDSLARPCCAS